jgi:hypothetical protein
MQTSDQRVRAYAVLLFALASLPLLVLPTQTTDAQALGRWTLTSSLSTGRQAHTATLLPSGKVLVAGGCAAECLASAELYDPTTGMWSPTGSMLEPRGAHSAILLNTGKVLVAGGQFAELYDPVNETWSRTGNPLPFGAIHLLTLRSGLVLAVSGREAQLYDASSGTWRPTGSMNEHRRGEGIALLGNGDVLTSGGRVGCCEALSSAEVYDVARGTWSPISPMGV